MDKKNIAPVAQLASTLHTAQKKRALLDSRVTWSAEDDEIFEQVQNEHKILSDRLAALHSARGSRISIPEFDRRRKAQKSEQA